MRRKGDTVFFDEPVWVESCAAVGGKKEGEGPLGARFDETGPDNRFGQKTWEKAEKRMIELTCTHALSKADVLPTAVSCALGGDLLNQCISSAFAIRGLGVPYLGL